MGGVDVRGDAVAEIEDVAGAGPEAGEDGGGFLLDSFRGGAEAGGVHVALQGDSVAHLGAGGFEVHSPV